MAALWQQQTAENLRAAHLDQPAPFAGWGHSGTVVLNTTEGTIAWRMHEARNQLRRALGVPSVVSSKSMERIASPAPGEADPNSYTLAFALASVLSV